MSTDQQLYNNIHIKTNGQLTIQSNVELMGNSQVIVESGGIIIIDGGTLTNVDLVLKPGACLRIINNGFYGPEMDLTSLLVRLLMLSMDKSNDF